MRRSRRCSAPRMGSCLESGESAVGSSCIGAAASPQPGCKLSGRLSLARSSSLRGAAGATAAALALRLAAAVRAADACLRLRAATDLLLAPALALRRHRLLL